MTDARILSAVPGDDSDEISLLDLLLPLAEHWKLLLVGPALAGGVALGLTYLITPTFTARTSFLPPQQQQSATSAALGQLGALAGLAGSAAGIKSPADQYVALMQSDNVADRMIDRFDLMKVYQATYRFEARNRLSANVRFNAGKKDGLISVEVDDTRPQQAADMANQYVVELRRLTNELALTEAQQRRAFFEEQLKKTRDALTRTQQTLQASGFSQGALKAEPRAAADSYARLSAEVTAAEVRLQTMRRGLADDAVEVQQQQALLSALRGQLTKAEVSSQASGGDADYIGKYRDFKYQETLFELFSRQFELARLDESREGALIQVVDLAQTPEWKSKPKRGSTAVLAAMGAFSLLVVLTMFRRAIRKADSNPATAEKLRRLRSALRGR